MTCSEQTPVVLANWQEAGVTDEGDCACPTLPVSPAYRFDDLTSTAWQVPATLYRTPLSDDYQLVFNYLGESSLAVLNNPAQRVMAAFHSPTHFSSFTGRIGDIQTDEALHAAQQLATLRLLIPVEQINARSCLSSQTTLTAWLHVSNACNLRCDYCYIHKTSSNMDVECGIRAVDAVIRSACSGGFKQVKLKYAGGEATLNLPLVLELHRYAKVVAEESGLGLDGVVLSNGVAINSRKIEQIQSLNLRLSISLDGVGDYHNVHRRFINGRGSFESVERTLDRLAMHGLTPFISITLTDHITSGLAEVVEYVLDRRLPFNINFVRDNECASGFVDFNLRDDQIIGALLKAFAVIERKLPTYSLLGTLIDRSHFNQAHSKTCGVGDSYMVIDHQGRVTKCHMEIEHPITDVFAPDPLALIRLDTDGIQNPIVDEKEDCKQCEWRYWCTGGCPLLTFRTTGRYDVKSPYCRVYKAVYPEMLRLEGLRLIKVNRTN